MSIKDSYSKKVTFNTQDSLEDKIDRLTVMMSKLTANNDGLNKQVKPKIFQSKRRGQMRNFYGRCNYNQRNYQNRYSSNSRDRRISFGGEYRVDKMIGRPRYEQNYRNDSRRETFRGNVKSYQNQNVRRQIYRGGYRGNYRNENYDRGRSMSRERQYQSNIRRNDRSSSSRSRSGSRMSTNRDRIRCYNCREYDHFTKDCLTTKEEKETAQI